MREAGELERLPGGGWRLRFVRRLPHRLADVWRAIDEPDGLAAWFPSTIEGERRPGAPLRFAFPQPTGADPIPGEMLAYEPPRLIEFRWGTDTIRIELRARGEGTELTLLDTLDDLGKGARDGAGWHVCLDALATSLVGGGTPGSGPGDWERAHAEYRRRFGPDASRVGPPER